MTFNRSIAKSLGDILDRHRVSPPFVKRTLGSHFGYGNSVRVIQLSSHAVDFHDLRNVPYCIAKGNAPVDRMVRMGQPETLTIEQIAKGSCTPKHFLEHILLEVRNAGVFTPIRGRSGGHILTKKPSEISISDLLRTVDGPIAPLPCQLRRAYQRCEDCTDEATRRIGKVFADVSGCTLS